MIAGSPLRRAAILAACGLALFLGACQSSTPERQASIETVDLEGLEARLESSPARAVLVNFWATW